MWFKITNKFIDLICWLIVGQNANVLMVKENLLTLLWILTVHLYIVIEEFI
jgi:hypothetical protein